MASGNLAIFNAADLYLYANTIQAVLVTGALHVDGLADTFDAAGGRSRERALEIMRDSRLGTFGASALALLPTTWNNSSRTTACRRILTFYR